MFAEAPNPFRVKVYGPAVEKPVIVNEPTYLIVDFKEAGPGKIKDWLEFCRLMTSIFKIDCNDYPTLRLYFIIL